MSIIKSIKQQLGLSGTPANNFTLDASADNGTMKLASSRCFSINCTSVAAGPVQANTTGATTYIAASAVI